MRSTRSSALRWPSWRRNTLTICSRLLDRLPPSGLRRLRSGRLLFIGPATFAIRRGPPASAVYTLKDWPHPHVDVAFGFLIVKPPPVTVSTKSTDQKSVV